MALINCSECGHSISTKAAICPACGAPTGAPKEEVMMKVNEENKSSVAGIVAIVASLIYPFFINPFGGPGVAIFLGLIPFSVSMYAIFKGNAKFGFVAITVTVIVLVSSQSLSWQRSYESSAAYRLDQSSDRASRSIDRYLNSVR